MNRQQIIDNLPADLAPPKNCPHCDSELTILDAWPFCPNWNCSIRVFGRMQKFVKVLDLKGVGEETLKEMAEKGLVKTPADLWDVTLEQYCKLDRKGEKHYAKLQEGLKAAATLLPAQIFASLDIEGLGTWEAICAVPGLTTPGDIVWQANQKNEGLFANADRVSPDRASQIIKQVNDRLDEINRLMEKIQVKETSDLLIGKSFVLTGKMSESRPKIEARIKELGGTCSGSVGPKTTYLVCNDTTSTSSKMTKARKLGCKIITEEQLRELMGE